jgi:hypothetical protein
MVTVPGQSPDRCTSGDHFAGFRRVLGHAEAGARCRKHEDCGTTQHFVLARGWQSAPDAKSGGDAPKMNAT